MEHHTDPEIEPRPAGLAETIAEAVPSPAEKETWKPYPGSGGRYEVSDLGNVRSVRVNIRGKLRVRAKPKMMSPSVTPQGYRNLTSLVMEGVDDPVIKGIHVMVLETFVGSRPEDCEAAHLNGNPGDDRLENLKWATRKENARHKKAHGTQPFRPQKLNDVGETEYQCRRCGYWKPADQFSDMKANKGSVCKKESECKTCRGAYAAGYVTGRNTGRRAAIEEVIDLLSLTHPEAARMVAETPRRK